MKEQSVPQISEFKLGYSATETCVISKTAFEKDDTYG
jgi:hypothetical protein